MKPAIIRLTTVVAAVLLATPLAAGAQHSSRLPRIGVLSTLLQLDTDPFRQGLRDLGYVEGQNIVVEWRSAEGKIERLPPLAADLVRSGVEVIVATSNPAIAAAQRATKTTPIVMVFPTDPVGLGFVASLARPTGNITGLTGQSLELQGKRLQLLKEIVPNVSRIGILWDPTEPGRQDQAKEWEAAARAIGVRPQFLEVRSPVDIESAFATMTREHVQAVLIGASAIIRTHRAKVADHATKGRLPTMCLQAQYVEAGCLMSYGVHFPELLRRAARFVDKILKGAKPSDLPVQQPTKFELVINIKTAKAVGVFIPQSLLLQADRVIE
jgi:putative ABC transport system substrate-binding protein